MENIKKCTLWEKPELVNDKDHFELLDSYVNTSRLWQELLKCIECGQLYFFLFYKEIYSHDEGECTNYHCSMWVPVAEEDKRSLRDKHPLELLLDPVFIPRIQEDAGLDGKKSIYWVRN